MPWSRFWWIAAFPIAWVVYTMIRGAVVDWYPYPFLDPAVEPGVGLGGVAVYVIAIASFILLIGSGIVGLSQVPWPYHRSGEPVRDDGARVTA